MQQYLSLIPALFLCAIGPACAVPKQAERAGGANGSAVRLCVNVQIAPGMWPPGSAAEDRQNLSGLLQGEIITLLRKDGGRHRNDRGKLKIVRMNDYAVCNGRGPAKATLRYEYLPNGSPYKVFLSVNGQELAMSKTDIHDISNEIHYAKVNNNQIYIIEDIRKRAFEIYELLKNYLIEE